MRHFSRHDFLSIDDIAVLNAEMAAVARLVRDMTGAVVQLRDLDTSLGVTTMASAEFINQIERNIDALAGSAPPAGMEPTRTWQGENRDAPLLSFRDVNRWFASVAMVRAAHSGSRLLGLATGSYVAADCGISQKIRRAL